MIIDIEVKINCRSLSFHMWTDRRERVTFKNRSIEIEGFKPKWALIITYHKPTINIWTESSQKFDRCNELLTKIVKIKKSIIPLTPKPKMEESKILTSLEYKYYNNHWADYNKNWTIEKLTIWQIVLATLFQSWGEISY